MHVTCIPPHLIDFLLFELGIRIPGIAHERPFLSGKWLVSRWIVLITQPSIVEGLVRAHSWIGEVFGRPRALIGMFAIRTSGDLGFWR